MALRRLFVANRGEIAVRIIHAARALGIETVLGCSAADRDSLGAELADRCVTLGPAAAARSYLDEKLVVHAALATGCDALHPGYGFLSERAGLARLCEDNGIVFVGPRAETIEQLGDKLSARAIAQRNGVPLVPGSAHVADAESAVREAATLGYPVVMKASAGGGGRGMVMARDAAAVRTGFERAAQEAQAAFGDGTLYLERFIETARHVEVQILGDGEGGVLHFGERDCSVQRRYQKLVEEAPCAVMPEAVRARLHEAAVQLAAGLRYRNAGTVEFLYDVERQDFHFIEVNARIQVEHPVTEMVTGRDLVACQLRIAGGEILPLRQSDIAIDGHAIEVRINAEDPDADFRPAPGRITTWAPPSGAGIRLDTHCRGGAMVPPFYDSMIGKLVVHGRDRREAVARLRAALDDFRLEGVATTLPLHARIAAHPDFADNRIHTRWLEQILLPEAARATEEA
ncbi:acetyl-CoA carboxylase biotin carboxylase subunit [Algiphilus sp.]|uniref:acetyl-CoA carboxylase biotin carboxylase subunit n=1 Tax=Algiphilus sp. TaxID=1872431 RepID=UPI0025C6F1A7|nr:acetyl-CoA carboxylase biotin carboxylase subunit [Algiphilus sp.]